MRTKPELANFCEAKNPSAHLPLAIQPIQPFSGCLITPKGSLKTSLHASTT
nr:hypothetical protein [uncultured Kingella sp.]